MRGLISNNNLLFKTINTVNDRNPVDGHSIRVVRPSNFISSVRLLLLKAVKTFASAFAIVNCS